MAEEVVVDDSDRGSVALGWHFALVGTGCCALILSSDLS